MNGGSFDPFAGNRWADAPPQSAPTNGCGADFGWPVRAEQPNGQVHGEPTPVEPESPGSWLSSRMRER
jgi:hypothetical protein